jgi:hypothetical protein
MYAMEHLRVSTVPWEHFFMYFTNEVQNLFGEP